MRAVGQNPNLLLRGAQSSLVSTPVESSLLSFEVEMRSVVCKTSSGFTLLQQDSYWSMHSSKLPCFLEEPPKKIAVCAKYCKRPTECSNYSDSREQICCHMRMEYSTQLGHACGMAAHSVMCMAFSTTTELKLEGETPQHQKISSQERLLLLLTFWQHYHHIFLKEREVPFCNASTSIQPG